MILKCLYHPNIFKNVKIFILDDIFQVKLFKNTFFMLKNRKG